MINRLSPSARGRLLMLTSAFSFGAMALITRFLSTLPSIEKVFFRSLFGLLMTAAAFVALCRPFPRPLNYRGLILRGVYGSLALICYFYAIDRCGLPKATLYCYTYPVWATLLAWLELAERPTARSLAACFLALCGVVVTLDWSHPTSLGVSVADVVGLLAGVLTGAAIVSVRRLRQKESSWWIVMFFTAIGALLSLPGIVLHYKHPTVGEWGFLLALAATAALAQLVMTKAYRFITAAEGSILSLTVVFWSALFSMVFLQEYPSHRFWVGATLVFVAVGWLVFERQAKKAPSPDQGAFLD